MQVVCLAPLLAPHPSWIASVWKEWTILFCSTTILTDYAYGGLLMGILLRVRGPRTQLQPLAGQCAGCWATPTLEAASGVPGHG